MLFGWLFSRLKPKLEHKHKFIFGTYQTVEVQLANGGWTYFQIMSCSCGAFSASPYENYLLTMSDGTKELRETLSKFNVISPD